MPVRYRLLGPVEVRNPERIDVGGPKQRALLATLLLHTNTVVPSPHIIEALWDARPPSTARSLVRTYVHTLRKRLGSAGADLVTESHGYRLRTSGDDLDVCVFERWVGEARAALEAGDDGRASDRFRSALELWGGPLADGVCSAAVERVHAPRLEEVRLRAAEDLAELDLRLGRIGPLVGLLQPLVTKHPFRERLLALHMLALYHSGRQAEALEAFHSARAKLSAELGIEPGKAVQESLHVILSREAGGGHHVPVVAGSPPSGPAPAAAAAEVPPPRQTPAAPGTLVGRETQLQYIVAVLEPDADPDRVTAPALLLTGLPGVGKTALLLESCRRLRDHYPDGELYADLAEVSAAEARDSFLLALRPAAGGVQASPSRLQAEFRSVTADRRLLVVLENVTTEVQLEELTPMSARSALIATSHARIPVLRPLATVRVDPLNHHAGRQLLEAVLGPERIAAEPDAAWEIVRWCGGLPLALRILAARLAQRWDLRLTDVVERLRDDRLRLAEFRVGHRDLGARIRASYAGLGPAGRRLFRRMAVLPASGADKDTLAYATESSPADVQLALDALVSAHLVTAVLRDGASGPIYRQPRLIRDVARQVLAEEHAPVMMS